MTPKLSELEEKMDVLEKMIQSDTSDDIKNRARQIRDRIHEVILQEMEPLTKGQKFVSRIVSL